MVRIALGEYAALKGLTPGSNCLFARRQMDFRELYQQKTSKVTLVAMCAWTSQRKPVEKSQECRKWTVTSAPPMINLTMRGGFQALEGVTTRSKFRCWGAMGSVVRSCAPRIQAPPRAGDSKVRRVT